MLTSFYSSLAWKYLKMQQVREKIREKSLKDVQYVYFCAFEMWHVSLVSKQKVIMMLLGRFLSSDFKSTKVCDMEKF